MINIYTETTKAENWLTKYRGKQPVFTCTLGFTKTGLIPGISAAGATPQDRLYTAVADAEFLYHGIQPHPQYPLPPLHVGLSPTLISRAIVASCQLPLYIFNAGLPVIPSVPVIDLAGQSANCLSSGQALDLAIVKHLFQQGLNWGEKLSHDHPDTYIIFSECVVGGTSTALAVLMGLGCPADGKINSSHPHCNHSQKLALVETGLLEGKKYLGLSEFPSPFHLVAAVGDPMQIVVAGMTIACSRHTGVMLAGGTQMLAVYALVKAITDDLNLTWQPEQIVVGTTRWVAEDPTGDTIGLAQALQGQNSSEGTVPLLATALNFTHARYSQLQMYEQGYVKEGVGAGGSAIAAHLYQNWNHDRLLQTIEHLVESYTISMQRHHY